MAANLGYLQGQEGLTWDLAFSPDGEQLVSATHKGKVGFWELRTSRLMEDLQVHEGEAFCLDFSPNGDLLCTGGSDESMCIWNLYKNEFIHFKEKGRVIDVAFSMKGDKVVYHAQGDGYYSRKHPWVFRSLLDN
jgi:WD40 repeat protein